MNQTAADTTTDAQPVDLEALRLQLEEDGEVYCDHRNPNPVQAREQLLHTLQTNDCREIITVVVDGDELASVFPRAGGQDHIDILEAYLNHGMNIDIKNQDGWSALICASYYEHKECVRFLLDHNAKVDIQNDFGFSALMCASDCGNTEIVEILLEKNANPDLHDKNGMTALMLASEHGFKELVQVLLNHGADIDLKDNEGKTAVDYARKTEIKEMIRNHVSTTYLLK